MKFAHRPSLDGMRAIAVTFVVLFHCRVPGVSAGYVGVDLFFVLSGYLISSLLVRELHETGKIDFLSFYARRARRLLPESVATLIWCGIFVYTCFSRQAAHDYLPSLRNAALYIENWGLLASDEDYWNQPVYPSPVLHYWSLSSEEQFYFVFPLLLLLMFLATGCNLSRVLGIWVIVTSVASYFTGAVRDDNVRHMNTFCRVYEIGAGIILSLIVADYERIMTKSRVDEPINVELVDFGLLKTDSKDEGEVYDMEDNVCAVIGGENTESVELLEPDMKQVNIDEGGDAIWINLHCARMCAELMLPIGLVVVLLVGTDTIGMITGDYTPSVYSSAFAVIGGLCCIAGTEAHRMHDGELSWCGRALMHWLESRPMTYIGGVSYAIYLIHWPIIIFAAKQLQIFPSLNVNSDRPSEYVIRFLFVFGLSTIIAIASKYLLQGPVVKHMTLTNTKQRVFMVSYTVICPIILVIFFSCLLGLPPKCAEHFEGTGSGSYVIATEKKQFNELLQYVMLSPMTLDDYATECDSHVVNASLLPHHIQDRSWYLDVDMDASMPLERISHTASTPDKPRVLITGDSHAGMFRVAALTIAEEDDIHLVLEAKGGCMPLYSVQGRCDYETISVIETAKQFRPHLLVLFNLFSFQLHKKPITVQVDGKMKSISFNDPMFWDYAEDAHARFLEELSPHVGRIVIVQSEPFAYMDESRSTLMPDCVCENYHDEENEKMGYCDSDGIYHITEMNNISKMIENALPDNGAYTTMDDILCPLHSCPAVHEGRVTYIDITHVSSLYWNAKRRPVWERLTQCTNIFPTNVV